MIGWLTSASSKFCNVIWARAFKDEGDLGLNTDWLRELALSASAVNVLPFAFRDDMPLLSCFECFNKEYNFLVLTLVGLSRSFVSGLILEYPLCIFHRPFRIHGTLDVCILGFSCGR